MFLMFGQWPMMAEGETGETAGAAPAPTPAPAPAPTPEPTIPFARFDAVIGERNDLREQVKRLTKEAARVEDLKQQLDAERRGRAEDAAFFGAGLADEEGRDIARYHYDKLPQDDRPPLGDWLSSFGEGEGKVAPPRSLAPFLNMAPAQAPRPQPNAGIVRTGTRTPATSGPTQQQIRKAAEDAARTGDWSGFDAMKLALEQAGR